MELRQYKGKIRIIFFASYKNPVTTLTDHMNVELPLDLSVPQPGCWDEGMGQWLIILLNYFSLIKELLTHPSSFLRKKNTDRPTGGQTALLICFQHITAHQTVAEKPWRGWGQPLLVTWSALGIKGKRLRDGAYFISYHQRHPDKLVRWLW